MASGLMSRSDSQCWNGTTLRVKFEIACGERFRLIRRVL